MSAGFEAFEPSVVVDDFARKICAICVWKETIIASLADGSLLFFQEQHAADQDVSAPMVSTWQVTRAQKGFTKRGAQQLQALESQPFLLSLSDDGVQLHSLPQCIQVAAASRTSRSAAFAWDEGRQLLATAGRKKVMSHRLDRSAHSLQEMTEYALPDNVLAVAWVGSNLLAATAKAYWLIVPAPPQTVEVLPGQLMTIYPTVAPQQLFAAGHGTAPLMARVGAEEVLVTKDSTSYFLGPDGKPSRKTSITWSQPPRCLTATPMYAIALLPSAVEVKGISRAAAATAEQMLLLPNMAVAAPTPAHNGCVYIASGGEGGIRQLRPLPLERQAKLLAAGGDFQGALELLAVLEETEAVQQQQQQDGGLTGEAGPDADASAAAAAAARRQKLEDVLRLKFGHHLFQAGEYDEALTQLSMCSEPDPLLLLRLFPQLVPHKFVPMLPTSAYGEPLPELQQQQPAAAAGNSSTVSDISSEHQQEQPHQQQQQQPEATAGAVRVVVPYLLSHRTRLLGSLEGAAADSSSSSNGARTRQQQQQGSKQQLEEAVSGSSGGGSSSSSSNSGSSSSGHAKSRQELRLLATVIDTAIMRAMLLQPDSGALLRLLQQVNYVDLEDGEAVLTSAGRYAELAALYQHHRRHEKGLVLLQQLSQCPEALPVAPTGAAADLKGLPGVWAAVRYLIAVRPQDLSLLQAHAGWVLQADPEAGLGMLLACDPPLQYSLVLPLLEAHAHAHTAVYLESALELGQVSPREVHSELLLIYLQMALEEEREGEASSEAHARQLSLSDLLVSRPHTPLKLFPDDHTLWAPRQQQQKQLRIAAAAAGASSSRPGSAKVKGGSSKSPPAAAEAGGVRLPRGDAAAAAGASSNGPAAAAAAAGSAEAAADGAAVAPVADTADAGSVAAAAPKYDASTLAAPHHPHHRKDAYQRLRELVYASPYIDPEYVLAKLNQGQLLEIRALMLERLGKHREALSVYVHQLHSMKLAEEYCDRVYEAGLAATAAATSSSSTAAAAAAAAAASAAADTAAAGVEGSGRGAGRAGELSAAAGGGDGAPKWDKVLPLRQQQQQRQVVAPARRGFGMSGDGTKPHWSSLPFGGSPQDIYMELVDAVMQGPGNGSDGSSRLSAGARLQPGKQQQQQQRRRVPSGAGAADAPPWRALSELLARKNDRINHLQVLNEVPPDMPLSEVSPLLCSMLLHNTETSRNSDVVLHLRRAENLMAREELVKIKQRVVPLTFDRACCICHKRMGGAVSVAYPGGSLAHYLCYKRSTQQQQQQVQGDGGDQQQQRAAGGGWSGGVQPGGDWGGVVAAAPAAAVQ